MRKVMKQRKKQERTTTGTGTTETAPKKALIKENLRNVGRTGFKLAKDLEVGE